MRLARACGARLTSGMLARCFTREKEIASQSCRTGGYSVHGHKPELYELRWTYITRPHSLLPTSNLYCSAIIILLWLLCVNGNMYNYLFICSIQVKQSKVNNQRQGMHVNTVIIIHNQLNDKSVLASSLHRTLLLFDKNFSCNIMEFRLVCILVFIIAIFCYT